LARVVTGDNWDTTSNKEEWMIVVGLVLMLIGFIAGIPILWSLGILVLVIGLILLLLGSVGREVGGRRHYF
jgi:uncharacterized membrane protein HdeD (DUF308 family)